MASLRPNFIFGIFVAGILIIGCENEEEKNMSKPSPQRPSAEAAKTPEVEKTEPAAPSIVTTASGLKYEILEQGSGPGAAPGQTVSVHYTGWLENGTKFDSSLDRGRPFEFRLGGGQVIRGWDEGVAGMKAGEKRKLTIPSNLGYGSRGAGGLIPPNATLIFDVQMVSFR